MLLDDFVVLNYVLVVFNLSKIDYLSFNLKILKWHFYFSWFQYKDFCHSEESFNFLDPHSRGAHGTQAQGIHLCQNLRPKKCPM